MRGTSAGYASPSLSLPPPSLPPFIPPSLLLSLPLSLAVTLDLLLADKVTVDVEGLRSLRKEAQRVHVRASDTHTHTRAHTHRQ